MRGVFGRLLLVLVLCPISPALASEIVRVAHVEHGYREMEAEAPKPKQGDTLVTEERMILIRGSTAFEALKEAKQGEQYTVLGMPRVSLALVSWRCAHADDKPWVLDWDIPHEMVILAVF